MTVTTTFTNETKIAKAESIHPFQTQIEFIFTDFLPNKNGQGIPQSEAQNIINTAIGMPIKISRAQEKGHSGAIPVGPIQALWMGKDGDRDVLYARASIWDLEYPDVTQYLKTAYAEDATIGTSWEIKYENTEELDGVNWLQNTVCVGTAIVDRPAYGETRTRVLAVAEQTMDEERTLIASLQEQLSAIYTKLSDMYYATYQIEEAEATEISNLDDFMAKFTTLVETLDTRAKSAGVALSEAQAELETTKTDKETAVEELTEKVTTLTNDLTFIQRGAQLSGIFSAEELAQKRAFILAQTESAFAEYVKDLRKVAKAEEKTPMPIPNFIGNGAGYSLDDIIATLKEVKK